jgi:shikimate kinase
MILLEASVEELTRRVSLADRPRVNPGTTIREDITMMWNAAKHKYYNAADIVYRTDRLTLDEEVAELQHVIVSDVRFKELQINTNGG